MITVAVGIMDIVANKAAFKVKFEFIVSFLAVQIFAAKGASPHRRIAAGPGCLR